MEYVSMAVKIGTFGYTVYKLFKALRQAEESGNQNAGAIKTLLRAFSPEISSKIDELSSTIKDDEFVELEKNSNPISDLFQCLRARKDAHPLVLFANSPLMSVGQVRRYSRRHS